LLLLGTAEGFRQVSTLLYAMAGRQALVSKAAGRDLGGHDWLPVVIQGTDYTLGIKKGISPFICIITLVAPEGPFCGTAWRAA
jgi:hypothetical protein